MKKLLSLFLMIALMLSTVGCGLANSEKGNHSSSGEERPQKLTLSSDMFDSVNMLLDDSAESSLGIVAERNPTSEEISESYFVRFKKDGTFEKVVFTKTITESYDDGTQEIRQEEIDGQASNLYVTEKFVFMSFSKYGPDSSIVGSPSFYSSRSEKVFVVDRATGKIYSLNDFSSFEVAGISVIKRRRSDYDYYNYAYYCLQTNNGVLQVTELMPNENISVHSVTEDKFGNFYVNNSQISSSEGKVFYVTENVLRGTDGYCYNIEGSLNFDYYDTGTITLYRRNAAGEKEKGDNFYTNFRFAFTENEAHVLCVRGDEIFQIGGMYDSEDRNVYGTYTGELFYPQANIPPLWYPYFVSDSIVVGVSPRDGSLYYYNLATPKTHEYRGTLSFEKEGSIPLNGELYSEGGMTLVRTEEIYGTVIYRLFEDLVTGMVAYEEFSRTVYNAEVLTIQSLN